MRIRILCIYILIAGILSSCQKEDDLSESIISPAALVQNETDKWIYENLTVPYNIEIKYRWDRSELDQNNVLAPPEMEKVVPLLKVLLKTWIQPYVSEGGDLFVKKLIPKQIVLVGSENIYSNGTSVGGTAEGGRKVVLYEVNNFNPQNRTFLKKMLHVMHHEFGHILHQNVLYPEEFKAITPGGYTSSWMNTTKWFAYEQGFITPYAKNIIDDDFVEMIAVMLTHTHKEYERILTVDVLAYLKDENGFYLKDADGWSIPDEYQTAVARNKIRQKEAMVVNYFESVYGIDFYSLQKTVADAMEEVVSGK